MPLPEKPDAAVGCTFGLEWDDVAINAITEVSGLKMEQDVIELKENGPDGKFVIKKLPGRPKAGEVTLTRGLTEDKSFEDWIKSSQFGKMGDARKGGAIIVYDYEGNAIKRYKMTNAWPKSLEIGSMKAGDANVLTEKITITYEEIEATT
jgi:phage tail-like protein